MISDQKNWNTEHLTDFNLELSKPPHALQATLFPHLNHLTMVRTRFKLEKVLDLKNSMILNSTSNKSSINFSPCIWVVWVRLIGRDEVSTWRNDQQYPGENYLWDLFWNTSITFTSQIQYRTSSFPSQLGSWAREFSYTLWVHCKSMTVTNHNKETWLWSLTRTIYSLWELDMPSTGRPLLQSSQRPGCSKRFYLFLLIH